MPIDARMVRWDDGPSMGGKIAKGLVKWDSTEPEPVQGYDLPAGVKSALNIAQALTFEHADEIGGKLGFDPSRIRETVKGFREEYPASSMLGTVSGSMLLPFGVGKAAFANPWATAAGVGAAAGALQGLGESENLKDAPFEAAKQAGIGALGGPLLMGMAKPVGSVMSALGTRIPGFGDDIVQGLARRQVARSLERDGVTTEAQLVGEMQRLGPEARIADAAGENTRGVLNLNAYLPGKTANNLEELLHNRIATRPERLDYIVDSVSGGMGRAKGLTTALTKQQQATATPLYQRAHSQSISADDDLIGILDAAKSLGAFKEAKTIATAERSPFTLENLTTGNVQTTTNTLTNQQTNKVVGASQMSVKDLDYVKRGLDSLIEANIDQFGKANSKARAFIGLKNELLSRVDALSQDFAAARQAFAGPEALKSAVKRGKGFWAEDAERLDDILADMTQSEQQAFKVGAAEQLREMVGNQTGQNRLLDVWKNRNTRERLQALLGDDVKFKDVSAFLHGEMTLKKLERLGPNRNSRTAQVEAMNEGQTMETLADAAGLGIDLARGGVVGPVTKATKIFGRMGTPESVRDGIGKILMMQYAPPEIRALMEAQEAIRRNQKTAAAAMGTAAGKSGLLD